MKVNAWDGEDAPVIEEEEYEFDDEVSSVWKDHTFIQPYYSK